MCNLVFAGNIGKLQGVDNIIETARMLEKEPVKFHILGEGSEYNNCIEQSKGLNNITFYGQKDLGEMPKYYELADAMLVTLKHDDLISKTLPGKVQTCMAAGKPIIASGENELKTIIEESGCGFVAKPDDPESLKTKILEFIHFKDKEKLARNARTYYDENFTKKLFFDKIEKIFNEVIK
jgi:glycosyltransferase involved in cell wall biosynthesis